MASMHASSSIARTSVSSTMHSSRGQVIQTWWTSYTGRAPTSSTLRPTVSGALSPLLWQQQQQRAASTSRSARLDSRIAPNVPGKPSAKSPTMPRRERKATTTPVPAPSDKTKAPHISSRHARPTALSLSRPQQPPAIPAAVSIPRQHQTTPRINPKLRAALLALIVAALSVTGALFGADLKTWMQARAKRKQLEAEAATETARIKEEKMQSQTLRDAVSPPEGGNSPAGDEDTVARQNRLVRESEEREEVKRLEALKARRARLNTTAEGLRSKIGALEERMAAAAEGGDADALKAEPSVANRKTAGRVWERGR